MEKSNPINLDISELLEHYNTLKKTHLKVLLKDKTRSHQFITEDKRILLDFTRQKMNLETIDYLHEFCKK